MSTTSQILAKDGLGLLSRHWECDSPRANAVIVHGLGEHSGRWERVGQYLADHGIAATSFDLRGHGASGGDRVDVETFDEYMDDVEVVLESLGDDLPTIIYGHSMGGLIATAYGLSARLQPDFFVLSTPALETNEPAVLRMAVKALHKIRPRMRLSNTINGEHLSKDPSVGEKYLADPLVQTKFTARFGAAFLAQMADIEGRYGELSRPAVVVHGADDPLVPPQASAPLAAVSGVTRKLFAGLRHESHNEPEWQDVLDYIIGWIDTQLA